MPRSPTKILYAFIVSFMCVQHALPSHLHSPVTSSLLDPNLSNACLSIREQMYNRDMQGLGLDISNFRYVYL